jgi:hypothetical protein
MLTLIISLVAILLELTILYRTFRAKLFAKYPFFCTYIACVLIVDVSRDALYWLGSPNYRSFYWATQFLSLVVGYGVILEIIRKALGPYAGAERFARFCVLGIFAAVFSFVTLQSLTAPDWSPATSYGELERDLRAVQVLVLGCILTVVFRYHVAIGKNLKGIILGYGLYIAAMVTIPALRSYAGSPFEGAFRVGQPCIYLSSLLIWTVALWNYSPNPAPQLPPRLESDYESLALKTRGRLGAMRSYIGRTVRP